ncbi:DsrE family protein [Thermosulfuriphilus sp.]
MVKRFWISVAVLVGLLAAVGPIWAQKSQKLAIVISTDDSETAWQALRIANYALGQGDQVSIFLFGKGVVISERENEKFDIVDKLEDFLDGGGKLFACQTAMKMHGIKPSEFCPLSGRKDLYRLIWQSDRVLVF